MPQYTLTLRHTTHGKNNPKSVADRRARAQLVAQRNSVTVNSITDNVDDGSITWVVTGADNDICDMLAIWERHHNVAYTGGPDCTKT
jgi:hypothetical protein